MIFESREAAGKLLGEELVARGIVADIVFGLTRGGIIVAAEVAKMLKVPLVPLVVRKIGAPGNPEFAVGAVCEIPGTDRIAVWWDKDVVKRLRVSDEWMREQEKLKRSEVEEYRRRLRIPVQHARSRIVKWNNVLLVDDGAATGISMMAAIKAVKKRFSLKESPCRIIVALPVASTEAAHKLQAVADEVVVLHKDPELSAVGQYYRSFNQVEWKDVRRLLK